MESVWLLLGSRPRRWSGRSVLGFLGPGHFAAKTPVDECWIVLDFLGFSRPNLYFSMAYEAFSGKNFSLSLSGSAETPEREPAEGQDCSWGKLNLFSDFLQEITARAKTSTYCSEARRLFSRVALTSTAWQELAFHDFQ